MKPFIAGAGVLLQQGRQRARDDRGQSLVEFALTSLLFFTIIFGTIEFGIAVWRYNMVANLAQEGARWASVRGANSASPASNAAVQSFVQSRAVGVPVTVTTTPAPSASNGGSTITVTVQTTYSPITGLITQGTMTLSSTASMIVLR